MRAALIWTGDFHIEIASVLKCVYVKIHLRVGLLCCVVAKFLQNTRFSFETRTNSVRVSSENTFRKWYDIRENTTYTSYVRFSFYVYEIPLFLCLNQCKTNYRRFTWTVETSFDVRKSVYSISLNDFSHHSLSLINKKKLNVLRSIQLELMDLIIVNKYCKPHQIKCKFNLVILSWYVHIYLYHIPGIQNYFISWNWF